MYPIIENIKDILPYVKDKNDIKIKENFNGTTSINYTTITNSKLFNCDYIRECRGITFNTKTGEILIRPFHKFFNIGEREETLPENLDWNNIYSITEKLDGSVCTTMVQNDKIIAKSMSSFDSIHAKRMTEFINKDNNLAVLCFNLFNMGYTPIFEYVSPEFQIVIPYEKEELILLAVRNMKTGEYKDIDDLRKIFSSNLKIVTPLFKQFKNKLKIYEHINDILKTHKDTEGYVIRFKNGQFVKAKTLWYVQLHRCKGVLSEKNIAEACLSGDVDDIKGMMTTMLLDVTRVNEIDIEVKQGLNNLINDINELYELYNKYDTRKQFANNFKHKKCFGLVMRKIDNKEVDYFEFYRKSILPMKFSNESVIN